MFKLWFQENDLVEFMNNNLVSILNKIIAQSQAIGTLSKLI